MSKRIKWSEEDLKLAVRALDNKIMGLNAAAREYGVPKATLQRYYKNSTSSKKTLGKPATFDNSMEDELCKHILLFEERMFGLSITDVRKMAFDVAVKHGLKHNFNVAKGMAGKKWYYAFMRRHPQLSLRQPEATSMARIRGFQKDRVMNFFSLLESLVDKHKLDGSRIFNVDESGFSPVQKKPQKIIGLKGKSQVGSATSGERGVNTTVVCCVNAAGLYVPPMIIFKRKRKPQELALGAPVGSVIEVSDTGDINSELFVLWLKHFSKCIKSSKEDPVLVLLDGHSTHSKNLDALEFSRENGIILLQLPSHTTHRLQPLDVAFFKPFSTYFIQVQEKWLRNHIGMTISQYQMAELISEAYGRAATVRVAENSFRASGIWPINRLIFEEHLFSASQCLSAPNEKISNEPVPSEFTRNLNEISPPPTAATSQPTTTGKSAQEAVELTSSPYKNTLRGKIPKAKVSVTASTKKSLLKEFASPPKLLRKRKSESEISSLVQDSSDSESFSDLDEEKYEELKFEDLHEEDFVVVQLEYNISKTKDKKKLFIGQIFKITDAALIECKFMRASIKLKGVFVFPDVDDYMIINMQQILCKIKPSFVRRGRYSFPISI